MISTSRFNILTPIVLLLGVFSVFMLTACQQFTTETRFSSAKGVKIESFDTVESLSEKILVEEHKLYPESIKIFFNTFKEL